MNNAFFYKMTYKIYKNYLELEKKFSKLNINYEFLRNHKNDTIKDLNKILYKDGEQSSLSVNLVKSLAKFYNLFIIVYLKYAGNCINM